MLKLNIVEWLRSFRIRQFSEDHSVVVNVYDNGRCVYRGERLFNDNYAPNSTMGVANGLLSQEYGRLLKEKKLARRRKGKRS